MEMMKLLVQYSKKNYVIKVQSLNSVDELKSHIKCKLSNAPPEFDLQYYDEDFKTYAELTSIGEVTNMTKLKVENNLNIKKTHIDTSKRKRMSPTANSKRSLSPGALSNGNIPEVPDKALTNIPFLDRILGMTSPNVATTNATPGMSSNKRPTEDELRGTKRKRHDDTSDVKRHQIIENVTKVLLAAGGLPNFLPDKRKGQTKEEIEKLKSFMSKQVLAASPEFTKVSQALDHTLADRRNYIVYGQHDINERHRCYPWLFTEKELIREFSRICNEDMMMKDKIFGYFCKVAPYVQTLVKESKIKHFINNGNTSTLTDKAAKELLFNKALIGIPSLLGEDACNLFIREADSCSYASRICIHFTGPTPYRDGSPYQLCVDGRHITLTSRRRALCASIAAHYAFNIGYCSKLFNFFTFIESEIFKLRTCKGPPIQVKQMVQNFKDEVDKDIAAGKFKKK